MTFKYLVTSGCSFSSNTHKTWPRYLATSLSLELFNWGSNGCGNHWISRSAIYQADSLLRQGVSAEEILLVVMWSSIDRSSMFISQQETGQFFNLVNRHMPVNFIRNTANLESFSDPESGYLEGCPQISFDNKKISEYKQSASQFFPNEQLAIESYENFLKLQWFCAGHKIKLINLTINDIMHYPNSEFLKPITTEPLTKDYYPNIQHLHQMIDFNQWLFYQETGGLFEYTRDRGLPFEQDRHHPDTRSHWDYVNKFLKPGILEKTSLN